MITSLITGCNFSTRLIQTLARQIWSAFSIENEAVSREKTACSQKSNMSQDVFPQANSSSTVSISLQNYTLTIFFKSLSNFNFNHYNFSEINTDFILNTTKHFVFKNGDKKLTGASHHQ